MKPTWKNEVRKLSDLVVWERNPRQINPDQAARLEQSFEEFGQVDLIAIGPGNEVYNGHQRIDVLLNRHGGDYEVEVRVASRQLSEKEREKLTVFLHKGAAGEWDFEILMREFDLSDLLEWGFKPFELGSVDAVNDANQHWQGMPEFAQNDISAIRSIKVNFFTQEDIDQFAKLVEQKITDKTISINYPFRPRVNLKGFRCADES